MASTGALDDSSDEQHEMTSFGASAKQQNDKTAETPSEEAVMESAGPLERLQLVVAATYGRYRQYLFAVAVALLAVSLHVFLGFAISHNFNKALGLLVLVCLAWLAFFVFHVATPLVGDRFSDSVVEPLLRVGGDLWHKSWLIKLALFVVVAVGLAAYLFFDTMGSRIRLLSAVGLLVYVLIGFVLSNNPAKIKWRPVLWGMTLQFVMGLLVLRWETGNQAFKWAADHVVRFLDYTQNGTSFVYGFLAAPVNVCGLNAAVFAFTALQTVIFFGSIVSVLYYWGVIQFVLVRLAWLMQFTMGTTAAESLNAAACIFLGQTEAALLIKPALKTMTPSEIHAVMTAGFACIAGSLFAAYIRLGACPIYLLSATVMSAPASLAVSKLMYPETKVSKHADVRSMQFPRGEEKNIIECISNGAVSSVIYVAAIIANLIVFLALIAFLDAGIQWMAGLVGHGDLTLMRLVGYLFYPLAYVMGVSDAADPAVRSAEVQIVAELMGIKTVLNEFIAYLKLGELILAGQLGTRAQMMSIYCLAGFSNISTIGSQLGILGSLCPEQKSVYARVAVRSLVAGSIACFMTACVAGILVPEAVSCPPVDAGAGCTPVG